MFKGLILSDYKFKSCSQNADYLFLFEYDKDSQTCVNMHKNKSFFCNITSTNPELVPSLQS